MNQVHTRKLTEEEYQLSRWLLENGSEEAENFLEQLENAEATLWKCECGCASFNFKVSGRELAKPGVHILSDYTFGDEAHRSGVFIFSSNGTLSGVEVYGLASDAPSKLPEPKELVPFGQTNA